MVAADAVDADGDVVDGDAATDVGDVRLVRLLQYCIGLQRQVVESSWKADMMVCDGGKCK